MTTTTEFNSFAESSRLVHEYIAAKYAATDRDGWHALAMDARNVMRQIARDGDRIRAGARSASGHGRFMQSQLDMNDKFRTKAEQVFQSAIKARNAS